MNILEQIDHYTLFTPTIIFYEGVCRQICLLIFHILILCSRMCPQTQCDKILIFCNYKLIDIGSPVISAVRMKTEECIETNI